MKKKGFSHFIFVFIFLFMNLFLHQIYTQEQKGDAKLDARVNKFLQKHKGQWYDMNVPASDGRVLFDIIVKNKYKRALEIGTSTGHSGVWIAWALSKTGGKLITVEINKNRYEEAMANFKEAGVEKYIDARLADAHHLVPKLKGPFDFVFCDADKGWYKNYFLAVEPKLAIGGCYTAHNISMRRRGRRRRGGIGDFIDYVMKLPNYATKIVNASYSGISVSYKKSEK